MGLFRLKRESNHKPCSPYRADHLGHPSSAKTAGVGLQCLCPRRILPAAPWLLSGIGIPVRGKEGIDTVKSAALFTYTRQGSVTTDKCAQPARQQDTTPQVFFLTLSPSMEWCWWHPPCPDIITPNLFYVDTATIRIFCNLKINSETGVPRRLTPKSKPADFLGHRFHWTRCLRAHLVAMFSAF